MFLVDTNIFVYAVHRESRHHETARSLVEQWRRGEEPWFATWSIVYEFLRVTTDVRIFEDPLSLDEAWGVFRILSRSPSFAILRETERHAAILDDLVERHPDASGTILHDAHIVALMTEHGVREIRTADADFHRFERLDTLNPLVS